MRWLPAAAIAFALGAPARAADHLDGAMVKTTVDPSVDITDVYAWTSSDAKRVYLVMDVFPLASAGAKFSPSVQYVFHVSSVPAYGMPPVGTTNVICTFDASQKISCWVGNTDFVTGDASQPAGLSSASGRTKVFAGLRDDPFFFNLTGFKAAAKYVHDHVSTIAPLADGSGCPQLGASAASTLRATLKSDGNGNSGTDFFAGKNVLAIVLSIDAALLNKGSNTILSVWASTHVAP